jgi:cytoskeletal protein RodZ
MVADAPPVGATMIVDSPFARRGLSNEGAPPTVRTQDYIVKNRPETESRRVTQVSQNAAGRAPIDPDFPERAGGSLTEELDQRPLFTRTRVLLGVAGVVLVAALVAVLFFPTHVARPRTPPQPDQSAGAATTDTPGSTDQKTSAPVEPQAKTPPPEPEATKPAAKLPAAVTKPPADTRAKSKKETKETAKEPSAKDTPAEPEVVVQETGSWSASDIPRLLSMAATDMGDGKYDKAQREYRIVLRLQPKNQPALDGISKLNKIQSDQQ